jgi:uncharacterized protein (DUF983 family)
MSEKNKNYLKAVVTLKCPKCREGNIFKTSNSYDLKNYTKMNEHCTTCHQKTELEVGFYYGTGYVSYALTIAYSVTTFVMWYILIGFSLYDNSIIHWLITNAVLLVLSQPYLTRLSRTIWLSWFVKYNPNWKQEIQ